MCTQQFWVWHQIQFYIWSKHPVLHWERKGCLKNSFCDQEEYTSPTILFLIVAHNQPSFSFNFSISYFFTLTTSYPQLEAISSLDIPWNKHSSFPKKEIVRDCCEGGIVVGVGNTWCRWRRQKKVDNFSITWWWIIQPPLTTCMVDQAISDDSHLDDSKASYKVSTSALAPW